jgi:hypothetical protein
MFLLMYSTIDLASVESNRQLEPKHQKRNALLYIVYCF